MADFSDLVTATKAVVDPATSAEDLAQIAQAQPSLRGYVAAHPNVYQGLLDWLKQTGGVAVQPITTAPTLDMHQPAMLPVQGVQPQTTHASHNRLLLFIAVVVVVLVVAIVLAVVRPWSSTRMPSSGPTLTNVQFVYMIESVPSVSLGFESHQDAIDAASNGPYAAGFADLTDAVASGGLAGYSASCNNDGAWAAAEQGFQAGAWPGNGAVNITYVSAAWLFDSAQHAATVLQVLASCGDDTINGYDNVALTNNGGVVTWGWDVDNAHNTMDLGFAQFGNVIFISDDADYDRSWTDWQAQSAVLKQAVDAASKN